MLSKNKICKLLRDYKGEYLRDYCFDLVQKEKEKYQHRIFVFGICLCLVICVFCAYMSIMHWGKVEKIEPSEFLCQSDTQLIRDSENLMGISEKEELLAATKNNHGKLFKLFYFVDSTRKLITSYNNINEYYVRDFTQWYTKNPGYRYFDDTIVIMYNTTRNEYALFMDAGIRRDRQLFPLIDYSLSNWDFTKVIAETYPDMFTGTPSEVYQKVYNYLDQVYSELDSLAIAEQYSNEDYKSSSITLIAGVLFCAVIVFGTMFLYVAVLAHKTNLPKSIYKRYNECYEFVAEAKNTERRLRVEHEARAIKEKEAAEAAKIQAQHPLGGLIDSLRMIQSTNEQIMTRRDEIIKLFSVAESVLVGNDGKHNFTVHRFATLYVDAFQENINVILNHQRLHHTKFDTPEEIEIINKTFDLYEKITEKFIGQSEAKGVMAVEVNLTTLETMAAMDGLY